ncbi:hypothetical protein U1Q18_023185 [Sarracenia purpurea var. burkii]
MKIGFLTEEGWWIHVEYVDIQEGSRHLFDRKRYAAKSANLLPKAAANKRSTASARAFLSRNGRTQSPPSVALGGGLAPPSNPGPSSPRLSLHRHPFFSTRIPVELGSGDSLMPLHYAIASSLLKSMVSSKVGCWGCLSEGFATPL